MIYPDSIGLVNTKEARLRTLESIWIQGKLRMWGEWSYVRKGGMAPGVLSRLCGGTKITKTAITKLLRSLKKSGCDKAELENFLNDILANKGGNLFGCTDKDASKMDRVVGSTLIDFPALIDLLHERYTHKKSKRAMAEDVQEQHPEWCYATCRNRVDMWLSTAEYMLYRPMNEALSLNQGRFYG